MFQFQHRYAISCALFSSGSILICDSFMSCRHFLLCLYGTVAIGLILAGRLKELRVVYILTGNIDPQVISILRLSCFFYWFWDFYSYLNFAAYYGIENSFWDLAPHVVQVCIFFYYLLIVMYFYFCSISYFPASWYLRVNNIRWDFLNMFER